MTLTIADVVIDAGPEEDAVYGLLDRLSGQSVTPGRHFDAYIAIALGLPAWRHERRQERSARMDTRADGSAIV